MQEAIITKILFFSPESVRGKCIDLMSQRGHDVVTASSGADALAMMRRQIFDALVMECTHDTMGILNFTAKAQDLQPSLAVFLADEWGDELANGVEELVGVLRILEDDERSRVVVENRIA